MNHADIYFYIPAMTPSTTQQHPIKKIPLKSLLKLTAQFGISAGKTLLVVVLAFITVNTLLTVYAIFRFFAVGSSWVNAGIVGIVVLLAFGFVSLATFLTYRYLLRRTLARAYEKTIDQRTKICEEAVQQAAEVFEGGQEIGIQRLDQAVTWSKTVYRYYQQVPVFFQSGITQYLNRIPVTRFLIDLKEDILSGDRSVAAAKLRAQVDTFVEEHVIGSPTNVWTWVLLLLNIGLSAALIQWSIV